MIVTTGNEVAGHRIAEYLGIVRGIVVRSPGIKQGILGSLKQFIGGNIEAFAQVCENRRGRSGAQRRDARFQLGHARVVHAESPASLTPDSQGRSIPRALVASSPVAMAG